MRNIPINEARLLATFSELALINSPSRHEGAVAERVSALLRALGAEVLVDQAGERLDGETGNLIARVPGTLDAPALLFCAHLDTVEPTVGLTIERHGALLASDGTTILGGDDKGGVAAILELLTVLRETGLPHPPLEIAFTVAEEVGLMGSQVLDYSLLTARAGFIADSSGPVGQIITRAPAQKNLDVTLRGRAAHAGIAPENGINAITVAARAIAGMRQGRIDAETTANIGIMHGGKATNIVPDTVQVIGEARSRDPRKLAEQVAHMTSCFRQAAEEMGAVAEINVTDVYPAFSLSEDALPVSLATQALTALGIPPVVTATGGGSDANFFNQHGIQSVILSFGMEHPHGHDETLSIPDWVRLVEWLYQIVRLAGEAGM